MKKSGIILYIFHNTIFSHEKKVEYIVYPITLFPHEEKWNILVIP